jgi:hypothetical protein
MRVKARKHVRNEGSRQFKSAPLRQRVPSPPKPIVYIDSKKSFNPDGNADALRLSKGRSFPLPCKSKPVGKI